MRGPVADCHGRKCLRGELFLCGSQRLLLVEQREGSKSVGQDGPETSTTGWRAALNRQRGRAVGDRCRVAGRCARTTGMVPSGVGPGLDGRREAHSSDELGSTFGFDTTVNPAASARASFKIASASERAFDSVRSASRLALSRWFSACSSAKRRICSTREPARRGAGAHPAA